MADVEPRYSRRRPPKIVVVMPDELRNLGARHALDACASRVHGAPQIHKSESISEVDVAAVKETAELDEQNDADAGACTVSGTGGVAVADLSDEQRERAVERCAKVIANPDVELAKRASCAGAEPGHTLEPPAAAEAMSLIARSARDLFGTIDAALRYLDRDDFGGTGLATRELLQRGRGTSVIARLDELRFGTRG